MAHYLTITRSDGTIRFAIQLPELVDCKLVASEKSTNGWMKFVPVETGKWQGFDHANEQTYVIIDLDKYVPATATINSIGEEL